MVTFINHIIMLQKFITKILIQINIFLYFVFNIPEAIMAKAIFIFFIL